MIGQSQTGTGKTHAYLLPLIHSIDPSKEQVQVVITAPTRELANQIFKEAQTILKIRLQKKKSRQSFTLAERTSRNPFKS